MLENDTPILIAGGGASGAMLALLLAQQGLATVVVEERSEPYDTPRAHAINPRSLEICRAVGLDLERMRRQAAPAGEAGLVHFLPRLLAPVLGVLPYERQDPATLAFTPTPLINLPQTEFEEILLEAVTANPLISYRRGCRWREARTEAGGILSSVEGPQGVETIHSRYLIGCDGAGSAVRKWLGIGMSGEAAVVSCVSIVFRADLRKRLADRPGMLFWTTDPAANGTFLSYHLDRLWSFVEMHPPGLIDMARYTAERCREIVLNAAGGEIPDLEIIKATPWTMTSQVADSYGRGNVMLAGDAAHRFPPTGGLGLNTGIQDAHNLAWKIAAVESGRAPTSLLGSYERERRPVALRNAEQSLLNARRLQALAALNCGADIWRDPARFEEWLSEPGRRSRIRDAVALQAEHFDSFGLQLGFSYPPSRDSVEDVGLYRPIFRAGHRLPHAWLNNGSLRSTLDLVSPTRFTLLLAPSAAPPVPDPRIEVVKAGDISAPHDWWNLAAFAAEEGILIRPDGHIAWRGLAVDAAAALDEFLVKAG